SGTWPIAPSGPQAGSIRRASIAWRAAWIRGCGGRGGLARPPWPVSPRCVPPPRIRPPSWPTHAGPGRRGSSSSSPTAPARRWRRAGETWLTVNVGVAPDDTPEDLMARVHERLGELSGESLPMLDPAPAGRYRVVSVMPPSHYEQAVARAVERIRAGELDKIV